MAKTTSKNLAKYLANYPTPPFEKYIEEFSTITPPFPNWEKSFISGPDSTLFRVKYFEDAQDKTRIWVKAEFTDAAEGPPGHIHGGASSALMDEALGTLVWRKGYAGVTQTLTLNYILPLPISLKAVIPLTITQITDRKIFVVGEVLDNNGQIFVQAEAKFHRLSPEDLERFRKIQRTA